MCVGPFAPPKPPKPPSLPPIQKAAPEPVSTPPPAKPLQDKEDKPKVDFAKKMQASRAKATTSSDLKIPLNQQSSGGSTGGLNV